MSFIEFHAVSYSYDEESSSVINNLNLKIEDGTFLAVLGRNGSGKSTFAKLINGSLVPDSGKVLVDGIETASEEERIEILKRVGMIFQNPDNQIVASVVEEDVAFGPENLGVQPDEIRLRVDEALKAVGMYEQRKSEPHNLSGGQKQRVAIAGILAMKTKCIVMDESTAMLDPSGRREVMDTVKMLNREKGITVIYITHFMEEAISADRVLVMDEGRFLLDGTPKEVFSEYDLIRKCGLDVPQTYELMKKLNYGKCILSVEECTEALEGLLNNVDTGR